MELGADQLGTALTSTSASQSLLIPPTTTWNSNASSASPNQMHGGNQLSKPSTEAQPQPQVPSNFVCLWAVKPGYPCMLNFTDPDVFYSHLAEAHVGRKSHGNLTLRCLWMGCNHADRPFSKRDHIVSHCRAHVPFKANVCSDCGAQFKCCTKQGHTYVDPATAQGNRPGPATLVQDKDTGHTLVREGPRLTGGVRKAGRRTLHVGHVTAPNIQQAASMQSTVLPSSRMQTSPNMMNPALEALLSLSQQSVHGQQHGYATPDGQFPQSSADQQQLELDRQQMILNQRQQQLDQQRRQQQLQNQIQQLQQQSSGSTFITQSPAFTNNPSIQNSHTNSLHSLLNTPLPPQPLSAYVPSPNFLSPNSLQQKPQFKRPAPPSMSPADNVNSSLTAAFNRAANRPQRSTSSHQLLQQPTRTPDINQSTTRAIHALLMPSPNFNTSRPHPYARPPVATSLLETASPIVPFPSFDEAGFVGGLAAGSPFVRLQQDSIARQMHDRRVRMNSGGFMSQAPVQFLDRFGKHQQVGGFSGSPSGGFGSVGAGGGSDEVYADLAQFDGVIQSLGGTGISMQGLSMQSLGDEQNLLSQAYGMINSGSGNEFGRPDDGALF
ncbi:hypothetical protein HDU79_003209 [Rhizoclosmatium sp. JEL0117]|nr:hypothetical protein HDU79_003209 [Rhizoclosmatium sp. JEL0117]